LAFTTVELNDDKTMQRHGTYEITLDDLVTASTDAVDLGARMFQFSHRLVDELVPQNYPHKIMGGF